MKIEFLDDALATFRRDKQMRYLVIGLAMLLLAAIGWIIYGQVKTARVQEAHKAFIESFTELEKAAAMPIDKRNMHDVIRAFDTAYERYGKTPFGPTFLVFKAQALVLDDKRDEAIAAMQQALSLLKPSVALYPVYATTLALMKIDSTNLQTRAEGEKELDALALDTTNQQRDRALYYAGLYAMDKGDHPKARTLWAQLTAVRSEAGEREHVWSQLAKQKMALLA